MLKHLAFVFILPLLMIQVSSQYVSAQNYIWLTSDDLINQVVVGGTIGNGYAHGEFPSEGAKTHPGIDIGGGCGLPIKAADGGEVIRVVSQGDDDFKSLGNAVIIAHGEDPSGRDAYTTYFHLNDTPEVDLGSVRRGQTLGITGETGFAKGCHLHFEVRHFEGIRSVYHPFYQKIYLAGEQKDAHTFKSDWSDPIKWLRARSAQWDHQETADLIIKPGESENQFSVAADGTTYFNDIELGTIPVRERTELHIYKSYDQDHAIALVVDNSFGALRGALISIKSGRVLIPQIFTMDDLVKYGAYSGVAWSPTGRYAAISLPQSEGLAALLLVDMKKGMGSITKQPDTYQYYRNHFAADGLGWGPIMSELKENGDTVTIPFRVARCTHRMGSGSRCQTVVEEIWTATETFAP